MSRQLCIASLHHIDVTAALGRGERIAENIFLTNDRGVILRHVSARMRQVFGSLEMDSLLGEGLVAYREIDTDEDPTQEVAQRAILGFLLELKKLQMALWIVGDNSVSVENAFLEWPSGRPNGLRAMNQWEGLCSTSQGTRQAVAFSREQLRIARDFHARFWANEDQQHLNAGEPTEPDTHRLTRALYFLQGARASGALSLKVAGYCSAFESLLSTDSSELSHKLAERIAWIVSDSPDQRLGIFRRIKSAYAIRSRAIHGSAVSKRVAQDLQLASSDCDNLLRSLLIRILEREDLRIAYIEREANPDQLEELLLSLTLGVTSHADIAI